MAGTSQLASGGAVRIVSGGSASTSSGNVHVATPASGSDGVSGSIEIGISCRWQQELARSFFWN